MLKSRRVFLVSAAGAVAACAAGMVPVRADLSTLPASGEKVKPMDLSDHPSVPPGQPVDLLFIHHSVGGQWLADPGPEQGSDCIHTTHPNGGGLRRLLQEQGYVVHEASYNSRVGNQTDTFDWLPKFRDQMDEILTCDRQDARLPDGRRNRVVMFKSCYPNNAFTGEGTEPGNPSGPQRTVANAKATYTALLESFARHPDVLFVCVTAPPIAPKGEPEPLWKSVARTVLGRKGPDPRLARTFNNWLKSDNGWLGGYAGRNVVVFDYYDVLTGDGSSDLARYGSEGNTDSHPSGEGQQIAARRFVPFLNRAVARAGLVDLTTASIR